MIVNFYPFFYNGDGRMTVIFEVEKHQEIRYITFRSNSATSFITPLNHSKDPASLVTQ